jgi:hypothetical protein
VAGVAAKRSALVEPSTVEQTCCLDYGPVFRYAQNMKKSLVKMHQKRQLVFPSETLSSTQDQRPAISASFPEKETSLHEQGKARLPGR